MLWNSISQAGGWTVPVNSPVKDPYMEKYVHCSLLWGTFEHVIDCPCSELPKCTPLLPVDGSFHPLWYSAQCVCFYLGPNSKCQSPGTDTGTVLQIQSGQTKFWGSVTTVAGSNPSCSPFTCHPSIPLFQSVFSVSTVTCLHALMFKKLFIVPLLPVPHCGWNSKYCCFLPVTKKHSLMKPFFANVMKKEIHSF